MNLSLFVILQPLVLAAQMNLSTNPSRQDARLKWANLMMHRIPESNASIMQTTEPSDILEPEPEPIVEEIPSQIVPEPETLEPESESFYPDPEQDDFDYGPLMGMHVPGSDFDTAYQSHRGAKDHINSFNIVHRSTGPHKEYQVDEFSPNHEHLGGLFTHVRSNNSLENGANGWIHFIKLAQPWKDLPEGHHLAMKVSQLHNNDVALFRKEHACNYLINQATPAVSGKYEPFVKIYAGGKFNHFCTKTDPNHTDPYNFSFLVMERFPNTLKEKKYDLFDPSSQGLNTAMKPHQFLDYWATVFKGLEWLHDQNLCHRDIKDENLLMSEIEFTDAENEIEKAYVAPEEISDDWREYEYAFATKYVPKIIDFGLSETSLPDGITVPLPFGSHKITVMNGGKGTNTWWAPEVPKPTCGIDLPAQVPNGTPNPRAEDAYHMHNFGYDHKVNYVSDYWSMGLVLYAKLFGEPFFDLKDKDLRKEIKELRDEIAKAEKVYKRTRRTSDKRKVKELKKKQQEKKDALLPLETGNSIDWDNRINKNGVWRTGTDADIPPIIRWKLTKARRNLSKFPPSAQPIAEELFQVIESCLEVNVIERYNRTRGIAERLRGLLPAFISNAVETGLATARRDFATASSKKHFDTIKMNLFRSIYVDGISAPGMRCYEANKIRAQQLVDEQWALAKPVFDKTQQILDQFKSQIMNGLQYEDDASWKVDQIKSHRRELANRLQFKVIDGFHDEINNVFKLLNKFRTRPAGLPESQTWYSPLRSWFRNLTLGHATLAEWLREHHGYTDTLVFTEEMLWQAAAAIACTGEEMQDLLHRQIELHVKIRETAKMIAQHTAKLYANEHQMASEMPELDDIKSAQLYQRLLNERKDQYKEWLEVAKVLEFAITNKKNAVKSIIQTLPNVSQHTRDRLDELDDLYQLVGFYIPEARRVLKTKFETLKRNTVHDMLGSDSNVVAQILHRNPQIQLPIRTKKKFLYRRGLKDQLSNKKLDLSYSGSLTDSVTMLIENLGPHDLNLLLRSL